MTNKGLNADLAQLKEIKQDVQHLIGDLEVSDVNVWRTKFVDSELKKIWDLATTFRSEVRTLKRKYKDTLTEKDGLDLDGQVTKLLSDAKKHALEITNKAQEVNPIKSMTEFEKKSLAVQEKSAELQEKALKEQQQATQEQRDLQAAAANVKKAEEMAKTKTCYEKVMNGTSQLAVDIQPSEDNYDWAAVGDDVVRKAMNAKQHWVKRLENMDEEFLKYKTLVSTWSPESLDDSQSEFKKLEEQLDIVRTAVEEAVKSVEKEDNERNLFTLEKDTGAKIEYPKFSGKFSECFLKFKDKMERAFKSNRVPKVDQVDKLREQLSGFALSLVPDSVKDIEFAFKSLEDQWGEPDRL